MRVSKDTVRARLWQILEERAPASGDRLPPERELTNLVGCSRETLRTALATLEAEGEIWRHVGQGTFRGRMPLGRPVKDTLLLEATTAADLMDARRLFEPQVAAAATHVHGDHHEQVVDAIAAGDGRAAHHAMAHHLEAVSIDMGVLSPMPSR